MKAVLAFLMLLVLLAVGGAFFLVSREKAPDSVVQAELAGVKFRFARAYARDEATGAGGLADRLSFVAAFPAFTPLSGKNVSTKEKVTLAVTPKEDPLDPAERPAKLYARFLTPETKEGPGGLVLREFEQGSPYDFERLYIAPPDGRTFFARCAKPDSSGPGEGCLSIFRVGAMDVEVRFPPSLLEQWDTLIDGARGLLLRMTSPPVRKKKKG
ncbi:MAG: hypothetical protein CTY15_07170 [Methylocystis sp.]|nr:MAG: hypothetical protein CTY15_07170 [Methylocystis sp.]